MGPKSSKPSEPTQLIPPTWPLQRWGVDLVGPLPTAQGNYKYAAVAVEYFTKWIETKPLINITSETIKKFFWQNIICRFGGPREIPATKANSLIHSSSENSVTVWARR